MKLTLKKKILAGALAGATLLGTGVAAYAYWTTTGSGSGSATTSSLSEVTLTGTSADALDLDGTVTMTVQIDNSANASAVNLDGKAVTVDSATCGGSTVPSTWFTVGNLTEAAEVAAGSTGVGAATAALTLHDTSADQNACQGKAVALVLSSVA